MILKIVKKIDANLCNPWQKIKPIFASEEFAKQFQLNDNERRNRNTKYTFCRRYQPLYGSMQQLLRFLKFQKNNEQL